MKKCYWSSLCLLYSKNSCLIVPRTVKSTNYTIKLKSTLTKIFKWALVCCVHYGTIFKCNTPHYFRCPIFSHPLMNSAQVSVWHWGDSNVLIWPLHNLPAQFVSGLRHLNHPDTTAVLTTACRYPAGCRGSCRLYYCNVQFIFRSITQPMFKCLFLLSQCVCYATVNLQIHPGLITYLSTYLSIYGAPSFKMSENIHLVFKIIFSCILFYTGILLCLEKSKGHSPSYFPRKANLPYLHTWYTQPTYWQLSLHICAITLTHDKQQTDR